MAHEKTEYQNRFQVVNLFACLHPFVLSMDEIAPNHDRAPWALGIIGVMLLLMTFKLMPSVAAVLLAALMMVFTRCVSMKNAYASINWGSLVLIAGMPPIRQFHPIPY